MSFERRDWKSALGNLQVAVAYYEKLAASQAATALYAARLDELRAMLRYCAYQLGDRQAAADLFSLRNRLDTGASAAGAQLLLSKLDVSSLQTPSNLHFGINCTRILNFTYHVTVLKLESCILAILSLYIMHIFLFLHVNLQYFIYDGFRSIDVQFLIGFKLLQCSN